MILVGRNWMLLLLVVLTASFQFAHSEESLSAKLSEQKAIPSSVDEDDEEEDDEDGTSSASSASELDASLTAGVEFTSDYISRGVTLTDHSPAIQAALESFTPSGIQLGIFASNARLSTGADGLELVSNAGYFYRFNSDLKVGLSFSYAAYFPTENNNWEIPLDIYWKFAQLRATYIPDYGEEPGRVLHVSLGVKHEVFGVTLGARAGVSSMPQGSEHSDYIDFRLSLAKLWLGFNWDLSFYCVDHTQFKGADDPRLVFAVSKFF